MSAQDAGRLKALAHAKLNLALVVGPPRMDGLHELVTVYQRVALADTIRLTVSDGLRVTGFEGDSLVGGAVTALAVSAGVEPSWHVEIEKRIPVAAGLGGGSSDAATALRLANETLERPLEPAALHALAVGIGADVPFFLAQGPQLGRGEGAELQPISPPQEYAVLLALPAGAAKESTGAIFGAFDRRRGWEGFEERSEALLDAVDGALTIEALAALPSNDLASSPLAPRLREMGAFRADVTGAGPVVYGLFERREEAEAAAQELADLETWLTEPAW